MDDGVARIFLLQDSPERLGGDGAAQCGSSSVPEGLPVPCDPTAWEGLEGALSHPCRLGTKVVEEGAGREPGVSHERPFPSAGGGGAEGPCQSKRP